RAVPTRPRRAAAPPRGDPRGDRPGGSCGPPPLHRPRVPHLPRRSHAPDPRGQLMARPRNAPQTRRPVSNPKAAIQDWLTLVDPDGALLTTTELAAVLPHGFEPMPADQRTELRARVADLGADAADRSDLRTWLLGTALDWDDQLVDRQA